jgi:hypothetical protein
VIKKTRGGGGGHSSRRAAVPEKIKIKIIIIPKTLENKGHSVRQLEFIEFTKIKYKYNTIILLSYPKCLTQDLDVALTAVAAVHTGEEYGVFFAFYLGISRRCREMKEDCNICV